jgi:hypothetical protein
MALDRRLQILLDEDRYQRVAARARERGTSVGAVIREAIDIAVPDLARKRAAAAAILAAEPIPVPETVEELKAEIDEMHHPEL